MVLAFQSCLFLILLLLARPITIPQSVVILALPTVSASLFFFLTPSVGPSETTPAYTISINNKDTPSVRLQNTNQRGKLVKRAGAYCFCSSWGDARESTAAPSPTAYQTALCLQPGRREHQERKSRRPFTHRGSGWKQPVSVICCQLRSHI